MKRFLVALCAFLFIAAGCGQTGPLYIPGNPSRIEPPPAAEEEAEEKAEQSDDADKR